jgi:hypothetical protein
MRGLERLVWQEAAPLQLMKLLADLNDPNAQQVGLCRVDPVGDQLRQQDLRLVERSRELGDPASAAHRLRCELVVH